MTAGYSGTPLARKLGIGAGHLVAAVGAPSGFLGILEPLPGGVAVRTDLRARAAHDVIVIFARTSGDLHRRFAGARAKLSANGGLWVAWPKRSSPLAGPLREGDVRAHGLSTGLVDNKICAIDADWSALRFVVRKADRASWPHE